MNGHGLVRTGQWQKSLPVARGCIHYYLARGKALFYCLKFVVDKKWVSFFVITIIEQSRVKGMDLNNRLL